MRTLITERLTLRDWNENDIGCEVFDANTIRYLITKKNNYAVVLKENNTIIGTIGLNEDADGNDYIRNIGIKILEQYQNRGFMSEALSKVIENAHEVTTACSYVCKTDDKRSQHIAEKFGFKYVKTFFGIQRTPNDTPCDCYYYTLQLDDSNFDR